MLTALFWLCLAVVAYTYLGYPAVVWAWAARLRRPRPAALAVSAAASAAAATAAVAHPVAAAPASRAAAGAAAASAFGVFSSPSASISSASSTAVSVAAAFATASPAAAGAFEPEVTLVVPAYNEADILEAKIRNCLAQNYPAVKLHLLFITDGSDDHSGTVLARFPQVRHLHQPARAGKAMAENRAIRHVRTPFVVFTDCNTLLNPDAVRHLVRHYADPRVGAVSGEKRVLADGSSAGAGEGLYWRYESALKRCDSAISSLMGAAGELVSFRTALFRPLEADTILDDFVQSMRIVAAGYRVVYEPAAYATEPPSCSLKEEMQRKVRICAGGWQALTRLPGLLDPRRQPVVTFLYVSHRVLRWSLTPLLLALLLPLSAALAASQGGLYALALAGQLAFYAAAGLGWARAGGCRPAGRLLVPLYFTLMNVAVFLGFWRFVRRAQPAAWAKARRRAVAPA